MENSVKTFYWFLNGNARKHFWESKKMKKYVGAVTSINYIPIYQDKRLQNNVNVEYI